MKQDEFNALLVKKYRDMTGNPLIRKIFGEYSIELPDEEILDTIRSCEHLRPGFIQDLLK